MDAPGGSPARMPLDPAYLFEDYASTVLRSPGKALLVPPAGWSELTGPQFGEGDLRDSDADLTVHGSGEAIGERIIVHGRVTDSYGRAVPSTPPPKRRWSANGLTLTHGSAVSGRPPVSRRRSSVV